MRNLREALKSGRHVVGTWLNSGSPILAELLATTGFDFVCVDVEHSAVDLPQAQALFQAVQAGNTDCAPIVRLHGVDYALAKRYLDAGARGVIGPLVNTAAQAELLVEAVKYPPQGKRGVGFCRANQYGARLAQELSAANEEVLVAVQIEHIEGVKNIDAILAVPGIDAAFIGPYDLSASMGLPAQFDHPDFLAARKKVLQACKMAGVQPGIHVVEPNPEELLARAGEGYLFLAYSLDINMVLRCSQNSLQSIRRGLAG